MPQFDENMRSIAVHLDFICANWRININKGIAKGIAMQDPKPGLNLKRYVMSDLHVPQFDENMCSIAVHLDFFGGNGQIL